MRAQHICLTLTLVCMLAALPLGAQVQGTLAVNDGRLQGTHPDGSLLLYSPDPVRLGSSISHWDTSPVPNLLMEPFATGDLDFLDLDITPQQMQDVLWPAGTLNVNIFNADPQGVGFTDPTPFSGAPGNPATTLGEARINLFNAVLGAWANTLGSNVDVDVIVTWQPLFCDPAAGATLGAAGATFLFALEGGGLPGPTAFHSALAEALIGADLSGPVLDPDGNIAGGDLVVFMNSALDDECLAPGTGWYYGLDGTTPAGLFDTAGVVLHELGHGFGFSNFVNESTGAQIGGLPGIYDLYTFDNTSGLFWDQMTDEERVKSAINVGQVTWEGPNANAAAPALLETGVPELMIGSPAEIAGSYNIAPAGFGGDIPTGGLTGDIACQMDDVADATYLNGCTPATNPGELAGKIALIDRGGCSFTTKVANAQAAGAAAAIVVNNAGNGIFTMGGEDPAITIPSVMVGRRDGNQIRQEACGEAAAFFGGDRFQVSTKWRTADEEGGGNAVMLTDESGYFWFFNESNVEVTVKVIDACNLEGFNNFWVFAAGMTDVEVTLTVVDTQSGASKSYSNELGTPFQPILDTEGFATCP